MEPFTTLTAVAAPLLRDNIDTDAIIPSREMRTVSKKGLAAGLFSGWRYAAIGSRDPDPDFVLNDPAYAGAQILVTGANFGCGSSREHAVWALAEYGFRAIIAPSFNPIFRGNCVANGVVPAVLPGSLVEKMAAGLAAGPGRTLTVDLVAQRIDGPAQESHRFQIDPESRDALLAGADPIDQTLRLIRDIRAFIDVDRKTRSWAYPKG
ncbi:3-isopropylmalate dehydratase small subunit [Sphingosinicella sp. LHD-64]|uniref:3-isopropylmalate dehydratase small subunit n=1 Tax=Sphingosinicella sp. LHD-64 TaxID=3072139 RepID=UPI00280E1AB8|nr:3-isopropylmalate dehydratase small subunit [Sphingosinicella sp. LHD-64]MDQ8756543.1 3-isopropylmalate dehydratase small subunit [Sphingosinicella sp. LHD-64]